MSAYISTCINNSQDATVMSKRTMPPIGWWYVLLFFIVYERCHRTHAWMRSVFETYLCHFYSCIPHQVYMRVYCICAVFVKNENKCENSKQNSMLSLGEFVTLVALDPSRICVAMWSICFVIQSTKQQYSTTARPHAASKWICVWFCLCNISMWPLFQLTPSCNISAFFINHAAYMPYIRTYKYCKCKPLSCPPIGVSSHHSQHDKDKLLLH